MAAPAAPSLPAGYSVQVDGLDRDTWHALLDGFADANLYQAWAYEAERSGERRMSHLVLRRDGEPVAAAQVRLHRLPLVHLGAAYVRWGPMWRAAGRPADPRVLQVALDALRHEYAVRRGLSVRILPCLFDDAGEPARRALSAGGFARLEAEAAQRTLLMSIEAPLAELRARLDQKWRNGLNRAERNGLSVQEGTGDELFEQFAAMHAEMRRRKRFDAMSDVGEFRAMQRSLPPRHRMHLLLAWSEGRPAAGVVCSRLGDCGVFLHGATSDAGLRSQASYLLQWRAIGWLQEQGATTYNLHGIHPQANPGTYHFKAGLCGRNGRDLHYLGAYQASADRRSQALVDLAAAARRGWRQARAAARLGWAGTRQPPEAPGRTP